MNPKNPSKSYIASLLKNEAITPTADAIEQCMAGWMEAAGAPKAERLQRLAELQFAFAAGDCEAVGYCSYTYYLRGQGLEVDPSRPGGKERAVQLALFGEGA